MATRIAQSSMYSGFISNMNRNLSDYMESNLQGSSQKKVNRPSDDPVGMTRILTYRASMAQLEQCEDNASQAKGWLSLTDSTMTMFSSVLTTLISKAEQASTSTMTTENRKEIASEVRQLFEQLIGIANTQFTDGRNLFAGHKFGTSAYEQGLGVTTMDPDLQTMFDENGKPAGQVPWQVTGNAKQTIMLRFANDGEVGVDELDYSWSPDGGTTWKTGTLAAGDNVIDMDGVRLTIPVPDNPQPSGPDLVPVKVKAYDPDEQPGSKNGTMLYIRPAAYYKGDEENVQPLVDYYGDIGNIKDSFTKGNFTKDVRFRLDESVDLAVPGGKVNYSYSLDNGLTWLNGTSEVGGDNTLKLQSPFGYLQVNVDPSMSSTLDKNQQFVVRPQRAELGLEIMPGQYISVTNAGKDIFGGMFQELGQSTATPVFDGSNKNVFETVSNLLAWLETGNQDGCGQSVEDLKEAQKFLLTKVAVVGGKYNRVETALDLVGMNKDSQTTRLSAIEDIDITTLYTKLAQQQMAYQTVLQSSSMIMKLNLTNYI